MRKMSYVCLRALSTLLTLAAISTASAQQGSPQPRTPMGGGFLGPVLQPNQLPQGLRPEGFVAQIPRGYTVPLSYPGPSETTGVQPFPFSFLTEVISRIEMEGDMFAIENATAQDFKFLIKDGDQSSEIAIAKGKIFVGRCKACADDAVFLVYNDLKRSQELRVAKKSRIAITWEAKEGRYVLATRGP